MRETTRGFRNESKLTLFVAQGQLPKSSALSPNSELVDLLLQVESYSASQHDNKDES